MPRMALEKFLRGIVLTGVFTLPFIVLYVSTSLFFPFITGKNFAFRILVEIVAGAWIALALIRSEYRPRRSWLLWAFAVFVAIIGIADIFGVYPQKSIWSNYERMEGWVTLAHLFVYFVVTVSVLNTEKLWRAWWHTSLGVSVIVGFIGLFQLFGWVQINQSGVRLDARLGNATYAGVYMLFHIFMATLFMARVWAEKQKDRAFYIWLYGAIIALDTLILFFTATRGAILGLIGGMSLAAFILIALAPKSRVAWRAGVGIATLVVLAGAFWLARDTALVRSIEPLQRLASIADEGFPLARFLNIQMAWEGFQERPLLGWGQENYAAVFDKHYLPQMYAQEQWFDRTHNIIMDWLIAGGILGLVAYLSLYLFALLAIWRSGAFTPYERAILTGLLAGYFFYLIFTFDNLMSYILFVSLLAYIAVRAQAGKVVERVTGPLQPKLLPIIAAFALIGTWGALWYTNASMIAANRTLIQAISPQPQGPQHNLELFKKALAYPRGGHQEIREQFAQATMSVANTEGAPSELKQQFIDMAVSEMEQQEEESPHNARASFFLGVLLDRVGAYDQAKAALDRARAHSPRKQGIIFEQALNAAARGAKDEALTFFKEAYELEPSNREAVAYYASALIQGGRDAEADAVLRPFIERQDIADQRLAAALAERGQFAKIVEIWTAYIEKNPSDANARMVLAGSYYSAGDRAKAIEVLEALKRDIPSSAAQVDALIPQVQAGTAQ